MLNPQKKIYPFDLIHDQMIFSLTSIKNGSDTLTKAQPYSIHGEPQIYTGLTDLTTGLERYLQTALLFIHYKLGKPLNQKKLKKHSKSLISLYNAVLDLMQKEDNFIDVIKMNKNHALYDFFNFLSDFNASHKEVNLDVIFGIEKIDASKSYLQKILVVCDCYFPFVDLNPDEKSLYKSLKKKNGNSKFIDSDGKKISKSDLKISQFKFEKFMYPMVEEFLSLIVSINIFLYQIGKTNFFGTEEHDYASFINGQMQKSPALTFLKFY